MVVIAGMTTSPVDAVALPPCTFREPCRQYRPRLAALVVFDRDCRDVTSEHYHRECLACGARWLEQCAR